MSVSLVSYGLGNLGSVANMFKRAGAQTRLVSTPEEVLASDRLLLPGIGAFRWQFFLIGQRAREEGWRAAEILAQNGPPAMSDLSPLL